MEVGRFSVVERLDVAVKRLFLLGRALEEKEHVIESRVGSDRAAIYIAVVASGRVLPVKVIYARGSICCVMRGCGSAPVFALCEDAVRAYEVSANVVMNVSSKTHHKPSRDFLVMDSTFRMQRLGSESSGRVERTAATERRSGS